MKNKIVACFFAFTIVSLCNWGCSSESGLSADYKVDEDRRMVHVFPNNVKVVLGTTDKNAKANETPKMGVKLSYDFYMDVHETTCGDFNELMELKAECENDFLPVSNVTFYDAVLYANARSKKENLDTAYSYESAVYDQNGHCINLEGYVFKAENKGYRLPTEAEWMFVAAEDWNLKKAWTADNSEFTPHEVCSLGKTAAGVCDIAGNVMEWVNDWKGLFKDTLVYDYVGAPDGSGTGERVVKGGSYRNLIQATQIYNRGEIYVVTSASKSDYLGFRLALGAIQNPTWMDNKGAVLDHKVNTLANAMTVRSKARSYKAKLFFRNDLTGNLAFIDYSNANLTVTEIKDTLDVYHPDVSPNGKWVAFCTNIEGVNGTSSLYVRNVDEPNSPAVKLNAESATIPRWRVVDGDTVIVYVTNAGDNSETADFMAKTTWQVPFSMGKFGKPEKLFDGAYHGGVSNGSEFAVSGSKLLRARLERNSSKDVLDTVWYNGEQACNVSLFRDGTNRVAFLDFAGKTGKEFVGERYGTHERLLVMDSLGTLIQSVAAPKGFSFDHTEWVAGNLVVATLSNSNGAHTKIVLVDLSDSSIVNLAEGDELWHPCLWTLQKSSVTDNVLPYSDSAALYYREGGMEYMFVLRERMEEFWKKKDSVTLVAMGSSRTMFGIHQKYMPDHVVMNFAYIGADLYDARFLIRNYVFTHAKKMKYLVLEVAPDMFFRTENFHWIPTYESNPGYAFDEKHDFWKDGIPEGFMEAVESCPTVEDRSHFLYDEEFLLKPRSWGTADIMADSILDNNNEIALALNYAIFKGLVDEANAMGVKVIAVIYPRHPEYRKTGTFGAYGPKRSTAKVVIDSVSHYNLIVMDENDWGNHDYTDKMAYDFDHLSYLGTQQFCRRLDSLIKTLK